MRKTLLLILGLFALSPALSLLFGTVEAQSPGGTRIEVERNGRMTQALLWGKGDYAVVLVHGAIYDAASWAALAQAIARDGMVALVVEETDPSDINAAREYLRKRYGVRSVALVGASAGGSAAMEATRQSPGEWDQLVVLSAVGNAHDLGTIPKLFVASEGEGIADSIHRMARETPGRDNEAVLLRGTAHAQAIFKTEEGPRLIKLILDRLRARANGSKNNRSTSQQVTEPSRTAAVAARSRQPSKITTNGRNTQWIGHSLEHTQLHFF